jgi:hypothetical protein
MLLQRVPRCGSPCRDPAVTRVAEPDLWTVAGESDIARQIERMADIARELGARAGDSGVTISDVRIAAENRGVLTGEERGRRLSYLGVVMRRAGLVPTDEFRRSDIPKSHGNVHRVFILRERAA